VVPVFALPVRSAGLVADLNTFGKLLVGLAPQNFPENFIVLFVYVANLIDNFRVDAQRDYLVAFV
jgi:hypothetical protein